ncbi:hypothetical protein BDZ97DRAFT_1920662 [Flammula alnicola]|nr:hypothetical protein BDZ97DRAFT_1920662 [Flammula alnicola]
MNAAKDASKSKRKQFTIAEDERRCEELARFLRARRVAGAVGDSGSRRACFGFAGSHHDSPARAGIYGIPACPAAFAPNVTPVSFTGIDEEDSSCYVRALKPRLFPHAWTISDPEKLSARQANFEVDFVKQKHVPGAIETNHSSLSNIIGPRLQQQQQFTNPFQQQQRQQGAFPVPPSVQFLQRSFPSQTPQQSFHPHPQPYPQTSPRSSLALGHHRASSMQPFFRRSWTMPMSIHKFGMSMDMPLPMDRDHNPLPDVDPELFAYFSFWNGDDNQQMQKAASISRSVGANEESVDPASPVRPRTSSSSSTALDTSIAPLYHSAELPPQKTSVSTSSSGLPSPSIDLCMNSYMHLDSLYPPESTMGMYDHDQYGVMGIGMGMGGMYGYDLCRLIANYGAGRIPARPKADADAYGCELWAEYGWG